MLSDNYISPTAGLTITRYTRCCGELNTRRSNLCYASPWPDYCFSAHLEQRSRACRVPCAFLSRRECHTQACPSLILFASQSRGVFIRAHPLPHFSPHAMAKFHFSHPVSEFFASRISCLSADHCHVPGVFSRRFPAIFSRGSGEWQRICTACRGAADGNWDGQVQRS
jgi:hypothetical protein